jgi:AcrR family transcriptional regulator
MSTTNSDLQARRRAQRRGARQRILDVTVELLENHSWTDITVELIAAQSALSRTAFYRHFGDRQALLLALLQGVESRLSQAGDLWYRDAAGPASLERALQELVGIYVRQGRLLRAVAESATYDPEIRRRYESLGEKFVRGTRAKIEAETAARRSTVADADELANCLTWMAERYLLRSFGQPPLADPTRVTGTLYLVWSRAIWATDAAVAVDDRSPDDGHSPGRTGRTRACPRRPSVERP